MSQMPHRPKGAFRLTALKYQLVDSALPTGAFAHSFGIEAAEQLGVLTQLPLKLYVNSLLQNISTQDLPFIRSACRICNAMPHEFDNSDLVNAWTALDKEYAAFLVSDVSRRASIQQGTALLRVAKDGFCSGEYRGDGVESVRRDKIHQVLKVMKRTIANGNKEGEMQGFLAPGFGFICSLLGLAVDDAEEMYMYAASRDIVSACIRLSLCGPIEAIGFQRELSVYCGELLEKDMCNGDQPLQTFPLGDLVQGCHSQLFRKMFNT